MLLRQSAELPHSGGVPVPRHIKLTRVGTIIPITLGAVLALIGLLIFGFGRSSATQATTTGTLPAIGSNTVPATGPSPAGPISALDTTTTTSAIQSTSISTNSLRSNSDLIRQAIISTSALDRYHFTYTWQTDGSVKGDTLDGYSISSTGLIDFYQNEKRPNGNTD